MEINQHKSKDIDVIVLSGRFDASEVPTVVKWFDEHPTISNLVVNLSGVNFIDSSGLATLVKGLKRCRQNKGDLYLSNLQEAVLIIFELTRLDKAFTIFSNEEEAVEAIAS